MFAEIYKFCVKIIQGNNESTIKNERCTSFHEKILQGSGF